MKAAHPLLGVLVMAYGTPTGPSDVEAFYTDVRRGRPPSPDQLADLERRYRAIGGASPLAERTAGQVAALEDALDVLAPGRYFACYGSKHAAPKIEDAVARIASARCDVLIGLVLAPHYSALSIGEYLERAEQAATAHGLRSDFVRHWHDDPVLVRLLTKRVLDAVTRLTGGRPSDRRRLEVVFSAHSLPSRILGNGDPYPFQLAETASLVAARADLAGRGIGWRIGWQSAGRTADPWIGPDVLELLRSLKDDGITDVVVCPAGFTSDHVEVLYDLDVEASALAAQLGIGFARTTSLNDDPHLAAALALRVAALGERLSPARAGGHSSVPSP